MMEPPRPPLEEEEFIRPRAASHPNHPRPVRSANPPRGPHQAHHRQASSQSHIVEGSPRTLCSASLSGNSTSIMVPVLPSTFYAYIKRNIPATSLRSTDPSLFINYLFYGLIYGFIFK